MTPPVPLGVGGSVHQPKCLSYTQVYGPTVEQRESGEEWLWADFNHAGPKRPDIHPAPGGDTQVSRESPLRAPETCSLAFHRQGHPRLSLGQAGLPGTSPALTLAQESPTGPTQTQARRDP